MFLRLCLLVLLIAVLLAHVLVSDTIDLRDAVAEDVEIIIWSVFSDNVSVSNLILFDARISIAMYGEVYSSSGCKYSLRIHYSKYDTLYMYIIRVVKNISFHDIGRHLEIIDSLLDLATNYFEYPYSPIIDHVLAKAYSVYSNNSYYERSLEINGVVYDIILGSYIGSVRTNEIYDKEMIISALVKYPDNSYIIYRVAYQYVSSDGREGDIQIEVGTSTGVFEGLPERVSMENRELLIYTTTYVSLLTIGFMTAYIVADKYVYKKYGDE